MAVQFNYTISTGTLNGLVASQKITNEIRSEENITISILTVQSSPSSDNLFIEFKANISPAEETLLNAIVAAHDGTPALEDPAKTQLVDIDGNAIGSVDDSGTRRLALDLGAVLTGPQGVQGDVGPQGPIGPTGSGGSISEYNYIESEGESSTTSGSYQQKLRLTTQILPVGDYEIAWYYEVYTTDIDMNHRVQLNDITTLAEGEHTSADEGDKSYYQPISGFKRIQNISGVQNIDIDYNDDGGGTARIRRARLKIKKVN